MKCRACWSEKAYVRQVNGWRGALMNWVGIVPLKCHHCYHRFSLPILLTIGKQLKPPPRKAARPIMPKTATPVFMPIAENPVSMPQEEITVSTPTLLKFSPGESERQTAAADVPLRRRAS